MINFIHLDRQALLLYKIIFVIILLPSQRLIHKVFGIHSVVLVIFIVSSVFFVFLQVQPVREYSKELVIRLFHTKFFQSYLLLFMRIEEYVANPKGRWSIATLISIFTIAFVGQFIFRDPIQLTLYTLTYTVLISYVSLRNSHLFPSSPISWEKTLEMLQSSLEICAPIPNKLNRDWAFVYTSRFRANVIHGLDYVRRKVRSCFSGNQVPAPTPEEADGLNAIVTGVAAFGGTLVVQHSVNERVGMREIEIARQNRESNMQIARETIAANERIAQIQLEIAESNERAAQLQLPLSGKQIDKLYRSRIEEIDKSIKEAAGPELWELKNERNKLQSQLNQVQRGPSANTSAETSPEDSIIESPTGLSILANDNAAPTIPSPKEPNIVDFFFGLLL
jgi:hypothetical protein